MRGTVAKRIRKEIYGDKNPRDRSYFANIRTIKHKIGFLQKLATLFRRRTREENKMMGGIFADGLRQTHQKSKKQYKEIKK